MAFSHGKDIVVFLDGINISSYFKDITAGQEVDTPEVTTFGKTARVYIPGLKDDTVSLGGYFDGGTGAIEEILEPLLGNATGAILTVGWNGTTIGNRGVHITVLESSLETSGGVDDPVELSAEFTTKASLERGIFLRPHTTLQTANNGTGSPATDVYNGTSVDNGAASTGGYDAVLQCFQGNGALATLDVIIEHSANNSSWSTLATFTQRTQVGAVGAQRLTATGSVSRYVRATGTLTIPAGVNTTPGWAWTVSFARL